jgi:hypothetical protein
VLIALALEGAVSWADHRLLVHEASANLNAELRDGELAGTRTSTTCSSGSCDCRSARATPTVRPARLGRRPRETRADVPYIAPVMFKNTP